MSHGKYSDVHHVAVVFLSEHLICVVRMDLDGRITLDIGCLRSVTGMPWASKHTQKLRALGRLVEFVDEDEWSQFGPANSWHSTHRMGYEAVVFGYLCFIWMSVVDGECPPLFSRQCMTALGMDLVLSTRDAERCSCWSPPGWPPDEAAKGRHR